MMKFTLPQSDTYSYICVSDIHLKEKAPKRTDGETFLDTCFRKLQFVFDTARERKADAVLCSGDIIDSPRWTYNIFQRFAKFLKDNEDVMFITTLGNHDVPGGNVKDYRSTYWGLLEDLGLLYILVNGDCVSGICGLEWKGEFTEKYAMRLNVHSNADRLEDHDENARIALVHAPIGDDATPTGYSVNQLSLLGKVKYLYGDIHTGFPITHFEEGAIAFNPGAMVRLNRNEVDRVPMCAWVTDKHIEYIEIPYEKDVFIEKEDNDHRIYAQAFASEYNKGVDKMQNRKPEDIIAEVWKTTEFERPVLNRTLEEYDKLK